MAKEEIEERRMYEIRKYNFRTATGKDIEVYPTRVKGLTNALRLVDRLNAELSAEEKADGVKWYRHP